MTTRKEQQQSIPEESYSNDDQKLIVSLLNEYSDKLLHVCHQIDKRRKKFLLFYFGGLIISGILLLIYSYSMYEEMYVGMHAVSTYKLAKTPYTIIFILFFLFINGILLGRLDGIIYEISCNITQNRKLISDAKILAVRLEKVIRIASQVQEHILSNFVSRLELDLRLADAELALQHYTDLLKTTKTTKRSFFRFFI